MRTVHEPEPPRAATTNANPIDPATGQPTTGPKLRLSMNGKTSAKSSSAAAESATPAAIMPVQAPDDPSPPMDNIQYIPARHPITGQPGFMITYPPDIHFSQFESEIPANQLMRLLRRQIHWAQDESDTLKHEVETLEKLRREEWAAKEALLEGVLQGEVASAKEDKDTLRGMKEDIWGSESKELDWSEAPWWQKELDQHMENDDDDDDHVSESRRETDVDHVLEAASRTKKNTQQEIDSQAERDEDMMAVGALMGLSGAA
jgi:hypothetical protein